MKVVMVASFKELSRTQKYCKRAPEEEKVAPEPPDLTEEQHEYGIQLGGRRPEFSLT